MISFMASSALSAAMTKDFVVTKILLIKEQNIYEVDFKNQAGVYKADEKLVNCLQESLRKTRPVRVSFNPMGLKLLDCAKVSTK